MKKHCLLALPLAGCLSSKVSPTTQDAAFMLVQENGQPVISSFSSAVNTRITGQEKSGDTLLVTYKKTALRSRASRLDAWEHSRVPLDDQTKYVRCANRLFRVVKAGPGFALEQVK
jgi:hypothetical protein